MRWGLSTCGCAFNIIVNEAGWAELVSVIERCPVHRGMGDTEIFDTATEENYRPSRVLILAQKYQADLSGPAIPYQFTNSRVLEVWPPLTADQKATLRTDCDAEIGVGKVIVH